MKTVKVGNSKSDPHKVNAGAPQGSVLACYIFNIAIDKLEIYAELDNQPNIRPETLAATNDFPAMSTPSRVTYDNLDTGNLSPLHPVGSHKVDFLP